MDQTHTGIMEKSDGINLNTVGFQDFSADPMNGFLHWGIAELRKFFQKPGVVEMHFCLRGPGRFFG